MKALFYKQLRLTAHPMNFVFLLSAGMLLIPNYPYTVAFFYVTLGLFFTFLNGREQRDHLFLALLPLRKRDTVKCSLLFSVLIQLCSIGLAGLVVWIAPGRDNLAGIDANPALLGMAFLLFAAFNGIFFPSFYRTGYKVGTAFLKANIATVLVLGLDIVLPHLVPWLDGRDPRQYLVLAVAGGVYGLVTWLAYRRSADLFERVDL